MNRDRTIFSQVFEYLPHKALVACVKRYNGERDDRIEYKPVSGRPQQKPSSLPRGRRSPIIWGK